MQDRYYHVNRRKYNPKAHIVLVTKYRKTLLQNDMSEFVKKAIDYLAKQNRWNIIAMETDKDHIHILLEYDATECICNIISVIKQRTTHWLWIRYKTFYPNIIGRNTHSGLMGTLLAALVKYHQKPSKSI